MANPRKCVILSIENDKASAGAVLAGEGGLEAVSVGSYVEALRLKE